MVTDLNERVEMCAKRLVSKGRFYSIGSVSSSSWRMRIGISTGAFWVGEGG